VLRSGYGRPSVADLVRSFDLHLRAENRAGRTIETYLDALRPADQSSRLKESSSSRRGEDVEAFIVDQLARWKPATAANRCRSLRVFYGWLQAEGEIPVSPMARMRPPTVPDQPVPVVREDAFRAPGDLPGRDFEARRDTALILLLVDVGPRHAEVAGMRLTDLDSTSRSRSWRPRTAGNVRCRSAAGLLRPLTATSESAPAIPAPAQVLRDIRDLRGETQQEPRAQRITTRTRRPLCDAVRVVEVTDALLGAGAVVAVGSLREHGVARCRRPPATHHRT
jgi:integrase